MARLRKPPKVLIEFPRQTTYWFDDEFFKTGDECAHEFGVLWLQVNMVIRDAMWSAGIITDASPVRWLCFRLAKAMCTWLLSHDYIAEQWKEHLAELRKEDQRESQGR